MTTTFSNAQSISTKKITKTDLNQLAKLGYGEEAYCEHIRTGQRGWYLYQGTDTPTFLGTNANEAFETLQSSDSETTDTATQPEEEPVEAVEKIPASEKESKGSSQPTKTINKSSIPPQEMLEILMEKFPHTFFRDPTQIKPIQKYIHKRIRRVLNNKYSKEEITAALTIYTQQIHYCEKLMEGGQRIDLEGNPCGEISDQHQEDARARVEGLKPMRQAKKKKPKPVILPPPPKEPPQLEKLVAGRMDLCLKINELPSETRTIRNGWQEFLVDTEGPQVKVTIKPKTWKKLCLATETYPSWLANIKGKMGFRIRGGFELEQIAVQIFEKKKGATDAEAEEAAEGTQIED